MQTALISALIALIFGGLLGGLLKLYFDYNSKVVTDLWSKRYEAYSKLWKLTEVLPKYSRKDEVTFDELANFALAMRHWYFETGGILLSDQCRDAYFAIQIKIREVISKVNEEYKEHYKDIVIDHVKIETDNGESITVYDVIQKLCSNMRTEMTRDLLSRRRNFFSLKAEQSAPDSK